jgi:ribosomal protein S21
MNKKNRQTELTYETLKQYKGFEKTSEVEASKQIETIKRLAKILFYLHLNEQQTINKGKY